MGVLLVIAAGIMVVLAVLIGINQMSSLSGSTRDMTATLELVHKATLLAESAVEEGSYAALTFDLNTQNGPEDGLFLKLRQYLPPDDLDKEPKAEPPVFDGATPFFLQAACAPELTYDAIKTDAAVSLRNGDPAENPVWYGPLDWSPITVVQNGKTVVVMPESNESVGIMGFAHTATLKGSGFFRDIDQSVQFSRPYKCLLMGPPWPFYPHSLYVIEFYGENTGGPTQDWKDQMTFDLFPGSTAQPTVCRARKAGPVKSAFAEFYRRATWFSFLVRKVNETLVGLGQPALTVSTASIDVNLARGYPVVFDADDAGNGRLEPLKSNDPDVAELTKLMATDPYNPGASQSFCDAGFDLARLAGPERDTLVAAVKALGEAFQKVGAKIKVRTVKEDEYNKYFAKDATIGRAYDTISPQAWNARATRLYTGPTDLSNILTKDSTAYELTGVYYFKGPGPYTLDKPFTGKGILVFEDNVTVGGFVPQSAADAHAVIVAVPQPSRSDPISISVLGEVTADLLAPYGTVRAGTMALPQQTIRGSVLVRYLADADSSSTGGFFPSGSTPIPMFPSIDRGSKSDYYYEPFKGGSGAYFPEYANHMQVFLHPGYVKKLYWTKRDR